MKLTHVYPFHFELIKVGLDSFRHSDKFSQDIIYRI